VRLATVLVVLATLVAACGSGSTSTEGSDCSGGAPIDVVHYEIDASVGPFDGSLSANVVLTATTAEHSDGLALELAGADLTVHSAAVEGRDSTWCRSGELIVVTADGGFGSDEPFSVSVRYFGYPAAVAAADGGWHFADDRVWINPGPAAARTWLPVGSVSDRSTMELRLRTPVGQPVDSGSLLVSRRENTDGTETWAFDRPLETKLDAVWFSVG
jgi:hypothetical protein